jgi:hypothetical protein
MSNRRGRSQAKRAQVQQRQQYRQGDVLVVPAAAVPDGATPLEREGGRVVLAHGEVTGHAHAITAPKAQLFRFEDNGGGGGFFRPPTEKTFLQVGEGELRFAEVVAPAGAKVDERSPVERLLGVALRHEEHAPIPLPPGDYQVIRQREYDPEKSRLVAD